MRTATAGRPWVFGIPAMAAVMALVLGLLPLADKRLSRSRPSLRAYRGLWMALLALLALTHGCLLAVALGIQVPVDRVVMAGLGALLAYSGSELRHLEPNHVIGIRTRATLIDPDLWRRVHQGAAPYLSVHGALLLLAALAGAPPLWLAADHGRRPGDGDHGPVGLQPQERRAA